MFVSGSWPVRYCIACVWWGFLCYCCDCLRESVSAGAPPTNIWAKKLEVQQVKEEEQRKILMMQQVIYNICSRQYATSAADSTQHPQQMPTKNQMCICLRFNMVVLGHALSEQIARTFGARREKGRCIDWSIVVSASFINTCL